MLECISAGQDLLAYRVKCDHFGERRLTARSGASILAKYHRPAYEVTPIVKTIFTYGLETLA